MKPTPITAAPPIVHEIAEIARAAAKKNRQAAYSALGTCLRSLQRTLDLPETETPTDLLETLRAATEDTVAEALTDAFVALPIKTEVEALELFNCMLDLLTGERAQVHAQDEMRIARAVHGDSVLSNDGPSIRAAKALQGRVDEDE